MNFVLSPVQVLLLTKNPAIQNSVTQYLDLKFLFTSYILEMMLRNLCSSTDVLEAISLPTLISISCTSMPELRLLKSVPMF